jgi:hypothetical protein
MSSTDLAAFPSTAMTGDRRNTAKLDGISKAAHTRRMDEREIWLKISNSCAVIAGNRSHLLRKIRSSSAIVVIRRPSAANRAVRPRNRSNRAAAAGTSAAHQHRVRAWSVPRADSRPQSHLSPEGTVPCTARTASSLEKRLAAATGEVLAGADKTSCLQLGRAVTLNFRRVAAFRFPHATLAVLIRSRRHYVAAVPVRVPRASQFTLETFTPSSLSEEFSMKKPLPHDKYFLRSIHQEIDLYDRKLAYLEKYGQYDSIADRKEAENKLLTKRASLAETAKQLVSDGVEFNPAELPRSFRVTAETSA